MPIDSRDKRASSLLVGLPFGRVFPVPDGTITEADFEQEAYLYRGIPSGAVVVESPPTFDIALAAQWFESDRPSRPNFFDGTPDPAEFTRMNQRAMAGRPIRPPFQGDVP